LAPPKSSWAGVLRCYQGALWGCWHLVSLGSSCILSVVVDLLWPPAGHRPRRLCWFFTLAISRDVSVCSVDTIAPPWWETTAAANQAWHGISPYHVCVCLHECICVYINPCVVYVWARVRMRVLLSREAMHNDKFVGLVVSRGQQNTQTVPVAHERKTDIVYLQR